MSMPKIPDMNANINITRDDVINMIIASIAMEELSIAHILNAEGEKLQYILGTLEGNKPDEVTICDVMAVNKSIQKTLRDVIKAEMLLQLKLEDAIELDENAEECQLTIRGQKIWIDDNAQTRPENVTISLLRNEVTVDTRTVSSKGDGRFTFACLPILDSSGQKYTYTIDELDPPEGYRKTVEGFHVTNASLTRTINGTKTWIDDHSPDRPESITVNLVQNGVLPAFKSIKVDTSGEENTVPFSFPDVPRFDDDGKPFVYTVTEEAIENYDTKAIGFNITNTHQ